MESLYLLVPLSVFIVILAAWVFFGAADSGQFDDLDGPGMRILLDDEEAPPVPEPLRTSLRNDNE
ncbi:MAG TPA: cbb3-type cytochrome oxidase assembly protein CcoS [Telluria sp.]|jgi:cbb3-type cytochrome oxidase maturation protein